MQNNLQIGRIAELLILSQGNSPSIMSDQLATVEVFKCGDSLHPDFHYPVLRRPNGAEIIEGLQSHIVVKAKVSMSAICTFSDTHN